MYKRCGGGEQDDVKGPNIFRGTYMFLSAFPLTVCRNTVSQLSSYNILVQNSVKRDNMALIKEKRGKEKKTQPPNNQALC